MSTIGQVRRMLRIQALEAAKREDFLNTYSCSENLYQG